MLTIPALETERLHLEPLRHTHSGGMFELWSAPEVCEYSGTALDLQGEPIPLPARSPADSDRIIEFFLDYERRGEAFRWAMLLRPDFGFIGAMGFNAIGPCSELAYHLIPRFWKNGFMYEACSAAVAWVTSPDVGSSSVEAFIDPPNAASIALVTRLGFRAQDEIRKGAQRYVLEGKHA